MPNIDLNTLLELVGSLSDSTELGSASERFRNYLSSNVTSAKDVRAYIETALEQVGDQYNKALQDLINHLGQLLGFEVTFGRYKGVRGQVGYDGLWKSSINGWSIVVEVKTTDVYNVRTATLLGYINALVSENLLKNPDLTLGLYVYGRFDSHTNQMENAIIVENRRERLRVVSVPALIDLLELVQKYGLDHETVLNLLLPFPVRIDPIVNLIRNVVSQEQERELPELAPETSNRSPVMLVETEDSNQARAKPQKNKPKLTDYTGSKIRSVQFQDKRVEVNKWRYAFEAVHQFLIEEDKSKFERYAPTLVGRKRPYISVDPDLLRSPATIPSTQLYFETNLSANQIARLSYALIQLMEYEQDERVFEVK